MKSLFNSSQYKGGFVVLSARQMFIPVQQTVTAIQLLVGQSVLLTQPSGSRAEEPTLERLQIRILIIWFGLFLCSDCVH